MFFFASNVARADALGGVVGGLTQATAEDSTSAATQTGSSPTGSSPSVRPASEAPVESPPNESGARAGGSVVGSGVVGSTVDGVTEPVGGAVGEVSEPVGGALGGVVEPVGRTAAPVSGGVGSVVGTAVEPAGGAPVLDATGGAVGGVVEPVARTAAPVVEPVVGEVASPALDPVVEGVRPLVEPLEESVSRTFAPVAEPVVGFATPLVEPVSNAAEPLTNPASEILVPDPVAPDAPDVAPPAHSPDENPVTNETSVTPPSETSRAKSPNVVAGKRDLRTSSVTATVSTPATNPASPADSRSQRVRGDSFGETTNAAPSVNVPLELEAVGGSVVAKSDSSVSRGFGENVGGLRRFASDLAFGSAFDGVGEAFSSVGASGETALPFGGGFFIHLPTAPAGASSSVSAAGFALELGVLASLSVASFGVGIIRRSRRRVRLEFSWSFVPERPG